MIGGGKNPHERRRTRTHENGMGVVRIRSKPVSASTSPFRDANNMSADRSAATHQSIERRRPTRCGHIKRLLPLKRSNI